MILVTGGAGFIGSNLCAALAATGNRVVSLDNYFTGSEANHVAGVEYRDGHTQDIAELVPETPEIVFHLGEYSRVEKSVEEPDIVHDSNVVGTSYVVEFWRQRGCKLVYAGSSTKFGDGGKTPYTSTKAANSEMIRATGEREGRPYAVAYLYNVYGPRERSGDYGTFIAKCRRAYERGEPMTITSPGTQRRNFTHVEDVVRGLVLLGERGQGDGYCLGNPDAFSVLEIAAMFGLGVRMMPEREGNRLNSGIDTTKARALGWMCGRSISDYIAAFHLSRALAKEAA